jgi:hypothetical protein
LVIIADVEYFLSTDSPLMQRVIETVREVGGCVVSDAPEESTYE